MSPEEERIERELRSESASHYLRAHSRPDGNGWRGFLKSNLFSALVLFFLSQAFLIGGMIVAMYWRLNLFSEWKGNVESTLKRMDDQGTNHSHYADESQDKKLTELETRLHSVEQDTGHLDVLESEHRRLTKDVEELKLKDKK